MAAARRFSHSGDLGDIIYFLPVMRALGGGQLRITRVRTGAVRTRCDLLEDDRWRTLKALLEGQDYVDSVEPSDTRGAEVDGDAFREPFHTALRERYDEVRDVNLVTWQAWAHDVDPSCQKTPWLTVAPNPVSRYVFNRTARYTNPDFAWCTVYESLGADAVFLGSREEHQRFVSSVGDVRYVETDTLLQAAEIIRGSECFVGNQSCLYALAEGMKHRALLEVWPGNPNCLFERDNVFHGWDRPTTLEALWTISGGLLSKR
jgi:hypothetical protein